MKLAYPGIDRVFRWEGSAIPSLVIENQSLLRRSLKDMYLSAEGISTGVVLSQNDTPIDFFRKM